MSSMKTAGISALALAGVGLAAVVGYSFATEGPHWQYLSVGVLTSIAAMLTGSLLGFLFGIPKYVSSGQARFDLNVSQEGGGRSRNNSENKRTEVEKTGAGAAETEGDIGRPEGEPEGDVGKPEGDVGKAAVPAPETVPPPPPETVPPLVFEPSTNLAEVSDWLTKVLLGAGLVQLTQLSGPAVSLINSVAAGLTLSSPPDGSAKVAAGSMMLAYSVWGFVVAYFVTTVWYKRVLEK